MSFISTSPSNFPFIRHQTRQIDAVLDQLGSIHIPDQVASLGQLTDVASAYRENGLQNSNNNSNSFFPKISNEYLEHYKQQHIQPWRFYYLDLDRLNRELQASHQLMLYASSGTMTTATATEWWWSSFIQILEIEVAKVHEFYSLQFGEIQRRIGDCFEKLPMKRQRLSTEIHLLIPTDLNRLSVFVKTNYRAMFVAISHFETQLLVSLPLAHQPAAQNRLSRLLATDKPFYSPDDLFRSVVQLNKLQTAFRRVQCAESDRARLFTVHSYIPPCVLPPSPAVSDDDDELAILTPSSGVSFESCVTAPTSLYSTSGAQEAESLSKDGPYPEEQYWVHPDNLLEVILHLSKYLDLDHGSEAVPSQLPPPPVAFTHMDKTPVTETMLMTTAVRTVYLDTPNLTCYTHHVEQNRPITELRLRSYNDDENIVNFEEKVYYPQEQTQHGTAAPYGHKRMGKNPWNARLQLHYHHNNNTNVRVKSSIKHRVWLKSKNNNHTGSSRQQHNSNDSDGSDHKKMHELEFDMQLRQLEPVLKTALNRTVFSNADLVISIDTEVVMVRAGDGVDDVGPHKGLDDIRFQTAKEPYPYASLSPNNIVRFPFAIIKIRYQGTLTTGRPPWLNDLCSSPMLEPVHNFSVYLHGISVLLPHKIHVFPPWISKISMDLARIHDSGHLLSIHPPQHLTLDNTLSTKRNTFTHDISPPPSSTSSTIVSLSRSSSNRSKQSTRPTSPSNSTGIEIEPATVHTPLLKTPNGDAYYCSFDHPSSSQSDPLFCKDCRSRRNSGSNGRTGPLSSSALTETHQRLFQLVQSFWSWQNKNDDVSFLPTTFPYAYHRHHHSHAAMPTFQQRALKLMALCSIVSTSLVFLLYYSLAIPA